MPEYSRPNLSIPSTLWGEVKVAAFRRGVRPVEVVIECLREKFTEPVKDAAVERKPAKVKQEPADATIVSGSSRMNSEVTGKSERDRQMEESPPVKVNPSTSTPKSKPDTNCKHSFAMKPAGGSKCVKCGWEP